MTMHRVATFPIPDQPYHDDFWRAWLRWGAENVEWAVEVAHEVLKDNIIYHPYDPIDEYIPDHPRALEFWAPQSPPPHSYIHVLSRRLNENESTDRLVMSIDSDWCDGYSEQKWAKVVKEVKMALAEEFWEEIDVEMIASEAWTEKMKRESEGENFEDKVDPPINVIAWLVEQTEEDADDEDQAPIHASTCFDKQDE